MAIPEQFKNAISYSRYRGVEEHGYALSDRYFSKIINGNLICTDDECDIDCDGNICLVTPDCEVYHIGTIPVLEDGAGKPSFQFSGDKLIIKWKEFYDNDHHHSGVNTEEISLVLTNTMIYNKLFMKTCYYLKKYCCNAFSGGCYRNTCTFYSRLKSLSIEIDGNYKKVSKYGSPQTKSYSQILQLTSSGWVLQKSEDEMPILSEVFRDSSGKLLSCIDAMNSSLYQFMVTDYKDYKYGILDRTDGVIEYYDSKEIRSFIEQGLKIAGVKKLPDKFIIKPLPKELVDLWKNVNFSNFY